MRRTGKLYTLTLVSALLSVLANILVTLWNNRTPQWHLWLDIVPQGFGMASVITSTLIVSLVLPASYLVHQMGLLTRSPLE